MRSDDLHFLYAILRRELEAAYAARPWNAARIDCIAAELLKIERTLAAHTGRLPQPDSTARGPRSMPAWLARSLAPAAPPGTAWGAAPNVRVRR